MAWSKTAWMLCNNETRKKATRHCSPMCLCSPLASEFKWREKKVHENLFGVVLEQLGELIWAICSREMDTLQQGSGRKKVKKKKKKECVWWCITYVWYHFVLLIWILQCFFLNSWIIYYCVLTQLVPDVDKMHHHTLFFSLFVEPRRLVICGGPALLWWSSCDWSGEFHLHGNHLLEEAGLRRTWIHPEAGSHRQPPPAVLQLSPWKEASDQAFPHLQGHGGLFLNYTFGYFHSCCTIPVADRTC